MNRPLYTQFAWAYDLIVEKPAGAWCGFIDRTLRREGAPNNATILDAGCGTGEYALRLSAMGYRVSGIDTSADMVAQARRKATQRELDVTFAEGDLLAADTSVRYDAVLCRGVLNDFTSDSDRTAALGGLASRLRRGGLLLLDVRDWERSAISKQANPTFRKEVDTERGKLCLRNVTRLDHEKRCLLIVETLTLTDSRGEHTTSSDVIMRCWSTDELRTGLTGAGFGRIELLGDYSESVAVGTTDRIIAIAHFTGN